LGMSVRSIRKALDRRVLVQRHADVEPILGDVHSNVDTGYHRVVLGTALNPSRRPTSSFLVFWLSTPKILFGLYGQAETEGAPSMLRCLPPSRGSCSPSVTQASKGFCHPNTYTRAVGAALVLTHISRPRRSHIGARESGHDQQGVSP